MKTNICAAAMFALMSGACSTVTPVEVAQVAVPTDQTMDETSRYIESFDGTRLAISVFRPAAGGIASSQALPVIVTQDRSDLSPDDIAAMQRYVAQGYVWIAQDRRGTGASFGTQTGFVNQFDAQDAKAVIDWSARQAFSSGKTVALGCSNQGAWQYLVATLAPDSLVAIAPACASPMLFDDAVAINGVPMIPTAPRPYAGECREGGAGARPGNAPPRPARSVDGDDGTLLAAAAEEHRCGAPMLGQYWLNMPRDGYNAYARYRPALDDTAMTRWDTVRGSGIEVLQLGGWFDAAVAGQLEAQRIWGGQLVMGPWVHGNRPPPGTYLPNADYDLFETTLAFFDRHAKGEPAGPAEPRVSWYTVNAAPGREWSTAAEWPRHPRQTFVLGDGVLANTAVNLSPAPLPDGDANWFGGAYSPLARWYKGDFGETNTASLLFAAAPFTADCEITGTPSADIWISADTTDTNLFAMLQDVAPDGTITYITDGRIRASWRKVDPLPFESQRIWHRGFAEDIEPIEPGVPTRLRFDFFPVSYVLKSGHHVQLSLTRSIGAEYQAPPGAPEGGVTVLRDRDHPSRITLPFRPD